MSFRMVIDDVFHITDRGVVVTGRVESGAVSAGSQVVVERRGQPMCTVTVSAVEFARAKQEVLEDGDNAGLLLRDLDKEEVASGDVIRGGGSIDAATSA